jgi:caffeoyl-CoA O-methyltransferase
MKSLVLKVIANYCVSHSSPPSALADELEQYTIKNCEFSQMLTSAWEGALLRLLIGSSAARRALEIGLYTGYSALTMAEALPENGELISCDIDSATTEIARRFLARSPHAHKVSIRLGPALETLKTLAPPFDFVFIDADKESYSAYFDACLPLLRPGGLMVADNVLWSGSVLAPKEVTDHAIVAFNDKVRRDPRVECVMLPIRDGVSLIRKR